MACPCTPACVAFTGVSTSVCLPDLVKDLHNFLIDDEDYGHVHTHPAQPRHRAFVEPGRDGGKKSEHATLP